MSIKLSVEIETSFVSLIEAAAQGWKDGINSYPEFKETLSEMCKNIYIAGSQSYQNKRQIACDCPDEYVRYGCDHWDSETNKCFLKNANKEYVA